MKKGIWFPILIIISFLFNCSQNVSNPVSSKDTGKVLLKIDKQDAPATVFTIKAYLTRENYSPITGTLNLKSDTTADVLLDNIDTGEWHLKIDAEDNNNVVLYSGETDVQIFAGFATQVNLTLNPTGAGTGSVYISINLGTSESQKWIDYPSNPMITSTGSYYDNLYVSQPVVFYDNGIYKMWYMGVGQVNYEPWKSYVLYSESYDGINWKVDSKPVMFPGVNNSWDSKVVAAGAIIKENGIYKMYYSGNSGEYDNWHIGLATSTDGINWQKYPEPILRGTSGWEYQIGVNSVIKKGGYYYLYYSGRNLPNYSIGVAISSDGINFDRYSGNPILYSELEWESNGISYPSVIEENGLLKMIYSNSSSNGFGLATSKDGLVWIKSYSNPIVTNKSTANNWASVKIAYPCWIKVGNESRIYYCGLNYNYYKLRIGMMRKFGN